MRKLILLILLTVSATTFAQGIRFEQGLSWQRIQAKAKAEHKYIFVDCFATWCGPCKQMDQTVYTDTAVGDALNSHFIAIKMQLDSTGHDNEQVKSGYAVARHFIHDYQIKAYPTYLFFDPEGNLVHRGLGYQPAAQFIATANQALDTQTQYYTLLSAFRRGDRQPENLRTLALEARALEESQVAGEAAALLTGQLLTLKPAELYITDNIRFIGTFTEHATDKGFALFTQHAAEVDAVMQNKAYARDVVDKVVIAEDIDPILKNSETPAGWEALRVTITKKYDAATADRAVTKAKIYRSYGKDWPVFTAAIVHYTDLYEDKDNLPLLNKNAGFILQYSKDKTELKAALSWSKHTADLEPGNAAYQQTSQAIQTKLNEPNTIPKN